MPSAHRESSGGAGRAGAVLMDAHVHAPPHVCQAEPLRLVLGLFPARPPPRDPLAAPVGGWAPCGRAAEAGGLARSSSWCCCWCSCSRPASPSSSSPTRTRYSCPAAGLGLHPATDEGTVGAEN